MEDAKRNGLRYGGIRGWGGYFLRLILGYENACAYRYLKCLRYYEFYLNNPSLMHRFFCFIYKSKLSKMGRKYSLSILPNTCGYGLRIMHISGGGGVLINAEKVGNYCGFNAGVLIGNVGGQENRPVIGDYVGFGPGAKAFGKITIGNNVFVAPNAVVTKNVPDNCIVGGVPAKIIKEKNERCL